MHLVSAPQPCPIVLTDYRTHADQDRDEQYGGTHVLHDWHIGKYAFGAVPYYNCVTRLALFEMGEQPNEAARNRARHKLIRYLNGLPPSRIYVLPNEAGSEDRLPATFCWQILGAPDAVGNMRGTCWKWSQHHIVPMYAFSRVLKELQQYQQAQWLRRWKDPVLHCQRKHTKPGPEMLDALMGMLSAKMVAVDIETMTTGNLITAIGVSDGTAAVSLPYDTYLPYQHTEPEPGWRAYGEMGNECRHALGNVLMHASAKVLHNHTFDIPRLQAEGFRLGGKVHDTFAAHAIALPELSHGLQHACASLLNVPPWKSIYHPKLKNITRDDEEFWIADPVALRDYNCDDAFYTWHLAHAVLPFVEVAL